MTSEARIKEIVESAATNGTTKTLETYGIPEETFNRYKREYRKKFGDTADIVGRVRDKFSDSELETLLTMNMDKRPREKGIITFEGEDFKFLVLSDTHIGSIYFEDELLLSAMEEGKKQGCTAMLHGGDVLEGMSTRPGQIYELSEIGYAAQRNKAVELLKQWEKPLYFTLGNHDCLSQDCQCLTKRGWLNYTEILPTDFVFSYDIEADLGRWMPITEIIIKAHDGDMYNFEAQTFRQSVTPTHRMLCDNAQNYHKNGVTNYGYMYAKDLMEKFGKSRGRFKVSAHTDNPDYPISDGMLKVVTWLLTDGSITRAAPTQAGSYTIWQSKEITPIIDALAEAGLTYSHHIRDRNITSVCGKILKKKPLPENSFRLNAESARKVREFLEDKSSLPEWMYSLSARQFNIVAHVLLLANGSCKTGSTKDDVSTFALHGRREALDQWQILFETHGYSAGLRFDTRGASVLDICSRTDTEIELGNRVSVEHYEGRVWCLATPLTNFMIRKEGRPSFTGNCWFNTKSGVGLDVGEDLALRIPNSHYLGIHEGVLDVNGASFMLWHGEDGNSYSVSYRVQKIIEAFTGGEKPKALFTAHTHKSMYLFDRNVHAVSTGSIQRQSGFMRYKRLAAHVGFWIVSGKIRDGEITQFTPTWYPFYK